MALRAILLGMLVAVLLSGQSTKVELAVELEDAAGRPVPDASVRLTNVATAVTRTVPSTSEGEARFLGLPAGEYRITVTKDGYATLERSGITLQVGGEPTIELTLSPGEVSQTIQVTADTPLLDSTNGTVSFTVDQTRVEKLPLNGRNYIQLIALSPGVTLPPGSSFPRINGSRPRTSEYIYDGISVLQPEPGQVPFDPIIDAIDEFRVEVNSYSAEFGRSNGGIIMVNQKSGSNQVHGTLFEFLRNEALNARNLFATGASTKPRFRRNQYGFVLGGPIQKNRTFFFTAWQGTRLDTGVVRTSTVPTLAERSGIFNVPIYDPASTAQTAAGYVRSAFADNRIPVSRLDPVAMAALARYPLPTSAASANNYRRFGSNKTAQDQFDVRMDRYFSESQRIFARYTFFRDGSNPLTPLPDGSGNIPSGIIANSLTRAHSLATEHSWTISPTVLNQLRFGYTDRSLNRTAVNGPIYQLTGLQQLGAPLNAIGQFSTSVTQWVDNFSWIKGGHSLKAGADIRLEHLNVLQPPAPNGQYSFTNIFSSGLDSSGTPLPGTGNSVASFLLGQVDRYSIDIQPQIIRPRARIAEFFLQDDWKATSRLSLNIGLRYTLNFPSTVQGGRGAVFNLNTQKLDFLGVNGFPNAARNLSKSGFGPRVGLAYRIGNNSVVRSGYGLTWIEMAGITTPFTTPLFPFIQNLSQQTQDNISPAFVLRNGPTAQPQPIGPNAGLGQGVFGVQRNNGSGYAQQWNFTLQHTFGANWSLEAGYLGSKLTRLGVPDINLNQLTVDQLALGSKLIQQVANPYYGQIPATSTIGGPTVALAQLLRPYPEYTTVSLYRNNIGNSTYHSFQTSLQHRFAIGLTFSASYTFSRLIDDAGQVFNAAILTGPVTNFNAADSHNKRLEKDVSTGNIPNVFSAGLVYQLPRFRNVLARGWEISGIARFQSGSPLPVVQATNFNAFAGFGIQRPNRIADPTLPANLRSTSEWFNTAAFTEAPQFTLGTSSRNPVIGPGYKTLDLMIGRTFALSETKNLEFRLEAFNVTNTASLGNPNTTFGSPGFGSITSANDPRVFEAVAKIHF